MKNTIALLVVLATLGLLTPTVHAISTSYLIDGFTEPTGDQAVETAVGATGIVSSTVTGLTSAVGGARTIEINVTSSAGNTSSLRVNTADIGTLSLNNGTGQVGVGTVTWDSAGAGLGGVDLTSGGTTPYVQSRILFSDLDLGFRIEITDTGNNMAYWDTDLGPGISYVNELLANFTNAGAVDFTSVNKIVLEMSGPAAQDAMLDFLEVTTTPGAVPEPMTMLGVIAGVGSVGAYIRRRRAPAA